MTPQYAFEHFDRALIDENTVLCCTECSECSNASEWIETEKCLYSDDDTCEGEFPAIECPKCEAVFSSLFTDLNDLIKQ